MAKSNRGFSPKDEFYMRRALDLADLPSHCLLPNPRVGSVIVHREKIVGEGCHRGPGSAHAELDAIRNAEKRGFKKFSEAEIYVTLEPCCHVNKRTPPCVPLLIEKKFQRVIVAHKDPNPQVSGKGVSQLKRAGLKVETGCLKDDAEILNQAFIKNQLKHMPYITAKMAMTFDGKMHDDFFKSKWITGEEARADVQKFRLRVDTIGIGRKTLITDNPKLNSRVAGALPTAKKIVIFGGQRKISSKLNIVKANGAENIVSLPASQATEKGLEALFTRHQIHHLLVEGGPTLIGNLITSGLIDEVILYLGKGFMGGKGSGSLKLGGGLKRLQKSISFIPREAKLLAPDIRIQGFFHVYRTH